MKSGQTKGKLDWMKTPMQKNEKTEDNESGSNMAKPHPRNKERQQDKKEEGEKDISVEVTESHAPA